LLLKFIYIFAVEILHFGQNTLLFNVLTKAFVRNCSS